MTNLKKTVRTCVLCRKKDTQKQLLRLKFEDEKLVLYNNYGRSFYICYNCVEKIQTNLTNKEYKKLDRALCKECKNNGNYIIQLKEILIDVR